MLTSKVRALSLVVLTAAALGACALWAARGITAAPVPAQKPPAAGDIAEPPPGALRLLAEGRPWRLDRADIKNNTLDLSEQDLAPATVKTVMDMTPEPDLPPSALVGVPLAKQATIMLDGKASRLGDLKKGVLLRVEMSKGGAAIRRVQAWSEGTHPEHYVVMKVDAEKRTVTTRAPLRLGKLTLNDLPLAKDVRVRTIENSEFTREGRHFPVMKAVALDKLKPGTAVALELGVEGGRYVVKAITFRR